jgi:hypothetical protein
VLYTQRLSFLPIPNLAVSEVDLYIHVIDVLISFREQLYTILELAADVTWLLRWTSFSRTLI